MQSDEDVSAYVSAYVESTGCSWACTATKEVACVAANLDMGFVQIGLWLYGAEGSVRAFVFYEGSAAFDPKVYKPDVLARANEALGAFDEKAIVVDRGSIELRDGSLTIQARGRSYRGKLPRPEAPAEAPPGLKRKLEDCEHFESGSGAIFPKTGLAVVELVLAHEYTNSDKSHACYITEQINDETSPHETRTIVLQGL